MQRRDFIKNLSVAGAAAGASSGLLRAGLEPELSKPLSNPTRRHFEGLVGDTFQVTGEDHREYRIRLLEVKTIPSQPELDRFELHFSAQASNQVPIGTCRAKHQTLGAFLLHLEANDRESCCRALFCLLCGERI